MNAIQDIIKKHCNYKTINKDKVKMRNIKKGINLLSALTYRFMYTFLGTTQDSITSSLNNDSSASFSREAYYAKEDNIQIDVYINIFNDLYAHYNSTFNKETINIVGVDGTYNLDIQYCERLNMGVFDISNSIPIKLESFGSGRRYAKFFI